MASTDALPIPQKNVAYRITFPIYDADGDLVTGATGLDSEVSKDGGTFSDCTNEATEIATASGIYFLDLTNTEMNADTVAVIIKTSSSGAKTAVQIMYPQEAGDIRVNPTYWNGTAVATPDTAGYPKVTIKDGTGTGELDTTSGGVLVAAYASGQAPLQPTVATRTLDVTATGAAGIDWANIENPTTAVNLSATNIDVDQVVASVSGAVGSVTAGVTITTNNDKTGYTLSAAGLAAIWDRLTSALTTVGSIGKLLVDDLDATISSRASAANLATVQADTDDIQTRLPAALVSGRMDSSIGAMAANTLTAAALASDAVNEIADQVWDELIAGHLGAGSTGAALNAAGSAGDPWATVLPGVYGAGTAGNIIGVNLDAAVTTRLAPTVAARTLDVTATGAAGVDWANVEGQATAVNLSATNIDTDQVVASVTSGVVITTNNDKTGYTLSAAGIQAVWDALTASLTVVGSVGKRIADNLDATVSSRLASAAYTAAPSATQNADAVLTRDMALVVGAAARSPLNALRFLRNRWAVSATTLTVYQEDDATPAWTGAVTVDAAADPVIGNDPT